MGPPALGTAGWPAPALVAGGRGVAARRRRAVAPRAPAVHVALRMRVPVLHPPRRQPDRARRVGWSAACWRAARSALIVTAVLPFIVLVLLVCSSSGSSAGRGRAGRGPHRGGRPRRSRRVRHPGAGARPVGGPLAGPSVQRDELPPGRERGGAAHPPGRRQPRAAHAAHRHAGNARGHARRRLSGRRGAPAPGPRRDARPVAPDRRSPDALAFGGRRSPPASRADRPRGAADGGRREPSRGGR